MFSFHQSRMQGISVMVKKILNKFDKINPGTLFEVKQAVLTEGNGMKSKEGKVNITARIFNFTFTVIVVEHWVSRLASVVTSKTRHFQVSVRFIFNSIFFFPIFQVKKCHGSTCSVII